MVVAAPVVFAALLYDVGRAWRAALSGAEGGDAPRRLDTDPFAPLVPVALQATVLPALTEGASVEDLGRLAALASRLAGGKPPTEGATRLASVLSRVRIDEAAGVGEVGYLPLALVEAALFSTDALNSASNDGEGQTALWRGLFAEAGAIRTRDADSHADTLLHLLTKYTWCLPAPGVSETGDVSLLAQAKTTCALACALAASETPRGQVEALLRGEAAALQAPRFALLGGDISGVQAFLYTITARGAARGLRGRSFYLQILGEAIARWLLRKLGLPLANLLYVGGGRLYLLCQSIEPEALAGLRAELDRALLHGHHGDLYLALATAEVSAAELQAGSAPAIWSRLGQALNEAKRRKFSALTADELAETLFAPTGSGGGTAPCMVCGQEGRFVGRHAEEERKCALCESLEGLGADLRSAHYLYLGTHEPDRSVNPRQTGGYEDVLRDVGLELRFFENDRQLIDAAPGLYEGSLLRLGGTDFLNAAAQEAVESASGTLSLGFYLAANVTPHRGDGRIAEFADLAAAARGVRRLGILRVDVDDLGTIFGRGLGPSSLARTSSLSFLLRLYFEGWVGELARRHNEGSSGGADHLYVIYSGGDDLFVVGSWDRLPHFALAVRRDLGRFANSNPAVHLSGGLVLAEERFPLYQSAEQAGVALEHAKRRQRSGQVVKDAVDFLGQTTSWDVLEAAARRTEELSSLIEDEKAPRALLQTLAAIYQLYQDAASQSAGKSGRRTEQVPYGRWMWTAAYSLTRLGQRVHGPAGARIARLRDDLLQPEAIQALGIAARWTELLLRREQER